ncbi:MAG TPA: UMP kinase [Patescibacteria group bacterium]|nr:UMP kinase [Patescibacteria group bacterium]
MGSSFTDKIVMSIGGSLVVPNGGIDTDFLTKLNAFVRSQLASYPNRQFFLVIGGGGTARHYRDAGKTVVRYRITDEDLDWLGVHATRLNAHLVRTIFHDIAHPHIIEHYEIIRKVTEPVVVGAGWKPGWSTDYDAVILCEDYNVQTIINLSNITKVYTGDPKKDPNARPIDTISWADFRKLVGETWKPGMNVPFDPIAAKRAQMLGLTVVVLEGRDFDNLQNYFDDKPFVGTIIS